MTLFGEAVALTTGLFLVLALFLALSFECVNGFHDTANAVATVIYTKTLKPTYAVVWSGCWNLIGVLLSTGTVAFTIVSLLPVQLVLSVGSDAGFAMVFSLLISAIIWNLGTWYLGLPASSTHTLTGAIMGVGLANAVMNGHSIMSGVNWNAAGGVFLALLISPLVGFAGSAALLLLTKALVKRPELYEAPKGDAPPPLWIRSLLVLTCTGVSFAHGSNDGQKGMGLIMLIVIGVLPAAFAVNLGTSAKDVQKLAAVSQKMSVQFAGDAGGTTLDANSAKTELTNYLKTSAKAGPRTFAALSEQSGEVASQFSKSSDLASLPVKERIALRNNAYLISMSLDKLDKAKKLPNKSEEKSEAKYGKSVGKITNYIPVWVKVAVAFALGIGTMIGWKRIVVTVGEKIGKDHLTYAQGASAELVTMATIGGATAFGWPVSTTHVLSSGIAGTMAANGSGLQMETVRNIILAWVLTLPVCVLLGAGIFSGSIYMLFHVLHVH